MTTASRVWVDSHCHLPEDPGEADAILASPQGRQITQMMHYSAVGDPQTVKEYIGEFAEHADADELIVVHSSPTVETRLHSLDLVADVSNLTPA